MKNAFNALALVIAFARIASAQAFVQIAGAPCVTPPALHCPDADCTSDRVINQGPVTEMKTRRTYFLDYPCDLKPGEPVTFVLSLHGAGSYGNWQRHYFPILDYKDKYRLVVATPNSPTHVWSDADDDYLHNIVDFVVEQIGRQNIKAFWLAGHSQGGLTSNRIIRTDYFKDKVDGWLSLSGGRLGGNPGRASFGTIGGTPPGGGRGTAPGGARAGIPGGGATAGLPANDFSLIDDTGAREMDDKGVPETSEWAAKYNCRPRNRTPSSTRRPDTSTTDRGRIRRTPRGGCCRVRAPRTCSSIRAAKMAASSPTWCGSRRDTPKAWSRTSPRRS